MSVQMNHAVERNSNDDEATMLACCANSPSVAAEKRTARFVCVLAVARDGQTIHTFRGTAEGVILDAPRGNNGFGYDPLFYFPQIGKTFAELSTVEKAHYSHRGAAFREFLPRGIAKPSASRIGPLLPLRPTKQTFVTFRKHATVRTLDSSC